MKINVTKSDGSYQAFDIEKVREVYKKISHWHNVRCPFSKLEENLNRYVVEWISTRDINKMIIKSAIDLISPQNTSWEFIAWRFAMLNIYKEVSRKTWVPVGELYHENQFLQLIKDYVDEGLYYDFFQDYTEEEILELGRYIDKKRDMDYNSSTVIMYEKRYLLNPNGVMRELPQHMYMAIAMYLSIPEGKETRLEFAKKVYDWCSKWEISLPTPTLLNARTKFHQLSSCFKFALDDDLRGIYHWIENMAQVSKYGWGIGTYLWNIRAKGSSIRWRKGMSWGVSPWAKVINDTAIAVNQLGARAGAISVTLDIWHLDIYDFLDLQTETGDIRRKAFDLFPSISVPDIFMERMKAWEQWTLFCPKEIEDVTWQKLQDLYWDEFSAFYIECERNPKIKLRNTVEAKELFKKHLKVAVETGMPYVFFRDTVNKNNPNKHAWMVYNTNLCTEICQNISAPKFEKEYTDEDWKVHIKYNPWDTVTCNLASLNVWKVNKQEDIERVLPVVMRLLDNVITLNYFPIEETRLTAEQYRPVGLWFLGLAQVLAENKIAYDSEQWREFAADLIKRVTHAGLKASVELAKERWAYPLFEWSEWSKGVFNWVTISEKYGDKQLEKDMVTHWTRFGYHFAPAPNTSTAGVVWTTAAMLPIYKRYFIETNSVAPVVITAPNLNDENFWFYKEYTSMDMNDVIDMMAWLYPYMDQSVSFEWMVNPATVSPPMLFAYYIRAWEKGIKTVYYVRSMSSEVGDDCASCSW